MSVLDHARYDPIRTDKEKSLHDLFVIEASIDYASGVVCDGAHCT